MNLPIGIIELIAKFQMKQQNKFNQIIIDLFRMTITPECHYERYRKNY